MGGLFYMGSVFQGFFLKRVEEDVVIYVRITGLVLCLIYLLQALWAVGRMQKFFFGSLYLVLGFCLVFIPAYSFFSSRKFIWILNAVVSAALFLNLVSKRACILLSVFFTSAAYIFFRIQYTSEEAYVNVLSFETGIFSTSIVLSVYLVCLNNRNFLEKEIISTLDKKVKEKTQKLQEALDIKREFLNNIGHEIKTPIHHINNLISVLHSQWDVIDDKEKKEVVSMLKSAETRLYKLSSDLLDLSLMSKGEKNFVPEKCDIKNLFNNIMKDYEYTQLINISFSQDLYKYIKCCPEEIAQVMKSLLDNALRYGRNKAIEVIISNEAKNLKVCVIDKGYGIPESEIDRVFQAFEQSSRTKTGAGGVGIGLAICKRIIDRHDGEIWVSNNKGLGATFCFLIPYKM